jgi:hypothetical protein
VRQLLDEVIVVGGVDPEDVDITHGPVRSTTPEED